MRLRNACIVAFAAMGLPSCEGTPPGQVIVVVSTDMTVQKDIDRIRIVVKLEDTGEVKYDRTFEDVGDPNSDTPIELPATLGILANEKNRAVRVRVMAFRGLTEGNNPTPAIRVVRDAVLTVPQDRIVTLPMPIEFLCDGRAKATTNPDPLADPDFESTCVDGETCIAGKCDSENVDSGTLETYNPKINPAATTTSDGTCFDTGVCFESATTLELDKSTCRATVSPALLMDGPFNVGLETEGSGTCTATGCFVPIDAPSATGWTVVDGSTISLPPAICEQFSNGQIARVVAAPVGPSPCPQKFVSIPDCAAKPLDPTQPLRVVGGQINPNAMVVDDTGIYWTMQGELDMMGMPVPGAINGAVKMVPKSGGTPSIVARTKGVPQGLVIDTRGFVLWTDATGDANGSIGWAKVGMPSELSTNALFEGLIQPGGITEAYAMTGGGLSPSCNRFVVWTELGGDLVTKWRTCAEDGALRANGLGVSGGALDNVVPAGVAPFSVVGGSGGSANGTFCFGYQGTAGNADGVVACNESSTTTAVATNLRAPRWLTFEEDTKGNVQALYFAELDFNGAIWRAPYTPGAGFSAAEQLISNVTLPSGLALDTSGTGPILYYTDRNSVNAFDVDKKTPKILATDRKNPGAIAVDADFVYWIEVGVENHGAIFKIAKPFM